MGGQDERLVPTRKGQPKHTHGRFLAAIYPHTLPKHTRQKQYESRRSNCRPRRLTWQLFFSLARGEGQCTTAGTSRLRH